MRQEKMTSNLPSLPSEVIEKIVAFLPLPDVCICMLVCKEWKVSKDCPYENFGFESLHGNY